MEAKESIKDTREMRGSLGPYLVWGAHGPVPNMDLQAVRRLLLESNDTRDHQQADILAVLDELAEQVRQEQLRDITLRPGD